MKLLLFLMVLVGASSCFTPRNPSVNRYAYIVVPMDSVDGRPTYSILLKTDKQVKCIMKNMYAEEIGQSLKTGTWQYNEDLIIK